MKQPSSAANRHLRAKLALLRRPAVWGASLFLLLPLLFLADYWMNPQRVQLNSGRSAINPAAVNNNPVDPLTVSPGGVMSGISAVPSATGSNAQLQDELTRLLLTTPNSGATTPGTDTANQSMKARPNRTAGSTATTTQSALPSTAGTGSLAIPMVPTAQGAASPSSPNAMTGLNPLQSALDRSAGTLANGQMPPALSDPGSATVPPPAVTQLYNPGTVTPGAFPQTSGQTYLPQTSPAAGTTGYTLPPALRTPANTPANRSFNLNSGSWSVNPASNSSMQPIPGTPAAPLQSLPAPPSYPAPTYVAPQNQVQPAPFSVPRTPPGRQIGNGEINTFSNP